MRFLDILCYVKLKRLFRKLFKTKQTVGMKRWDSDAQYYAVLTLSIVALIVAIIS